MVVEESKEGDCHCNDENGERIADLGGYERGNAKDVLMEATTGDVKMDFQGTYGGSSRFGLRSNSISPSLGGGIKFSGDHTLVGVFHGTTGLGASFEGVVEACRSKVTRRRHWSLI